MLSFDCFWSNHSDSHFLFHIKLVTYKKTFTDFTKNSQDIPEEFFYYGAHATYADFLRMDGQTSKAMDEENKASTYLATELEKLDIISNNNTIRRKFTTYVSTQSR